MSGFLSRWLQSRTTSRRQRASGERPNGASMVPAGGGANLPAPRGGSNLPAPQPSPANGVAPSYSGRLFIVEGIDGSGKSTQLDLLRKWLVNLGYVVVFSEWNSSPIVKGITRRGKRKHLLTPTSFSLIHAADFANRTVSQILPALRAGAIVLADRYVYTAFARDAARGVNRAWLRRLYSFAPRPASICVCARTRTSRSVASRT
jgi:hypothetical protein